MPELDTIQAKKVYDNISAKYNIGDYETYLSKMQDPVNREKFFNNVSKQKSGIIIEVNMLRFRRCFDDEL